MEDVVVCCVLLRKYACKDQLGVSNVCVCVYVCVYVYIYMCVCVYMCVYVCVCT